MSEQADSLFLRGARAMDDFALKERIRGAALFYAQTIIIAPESKPKNFALHVVLNPFDVDVTLLAFVCVDEDIAALIEAGETGDSVDTSNIPDATVYTKVVAKWGLVAEKYPYNPLSPPDSSGSDPDPV